MTAPAKLKRAGKAARAPKRKSGSRRDSAAVKPPTTGAADQKASPADSKTKTSCVIALLKRPTGASLNELVAATGWQPHTTRAALTGLRKKGHGISSDKVDGVRRYKADPAK